MLYLCMPYRHVDVKVNTVAIVAESATGKERAAARTQPATSEAARGLEFGQVRSGPQFS